MRKSLCLILMVAACGDDANNGQPAPGTASTPAAIAAANATPKGQLTPQVHVEERVTEPERSTIRHQFRDRDFDDSTNRDPFSSLAMAEVKNATTTGPTTPTVVATCHGDVIASNYSYSDLKLVGIVTQGTQRKVLMMDPGNLGRIIKSGDCVGKEKAVVKEIGNGYLTFQIVPEVQPGQTPHPEEHSLTLHEKDLDVAATGDLSQPTPDTGPEVAPVLPNAPTSPTPPNGRQTAPSTQQPAQNKPKR